MSGPAPITDNGIHLNALGYWELPGRSPPRWGFARRVSIFGAKAVATAARPGAVPLRGHRKRPALPADAGGSGRRGGIPSRRPPTPVPGLAPGRYTLKIDGTAVATADASGWEKGEPIQSGPDYDQVEALRRAIIAKNRLYFYRWRPQNETYLFGFRKHEQGNNAREIPSSTRWSPNRKSPSPGSACRSNTPMN